jgi:superfamily II DNA helicase RecQ
MPLLTQYASFYVSPFGEKSVTDELNSFLRSHRIVNVEKRLVDGERGTGWVFLIEYGNTDGKSTSSTSSQRIDYREVLNPVEYALYDKLRNLRKQIAEKAGIPVYAVFTNDQLASIWLAWIIIFLKS